MGHSRSTDWCAYKEHTTLAGSRRVIAYYLPQFHAIPENDAYWGKGFTEWRNVARGLPLFEGHIQPRHPADLGFYDLSNPHVLRQQAALARNYGIGGWAFYYYWFDGRKVLDTPIEILWRNQDIDMDFCVFWANENWTRSWDGMHDNVLLRQNHSEQDDIAFIAEVAKYFEDRRYLRHHGQPLLMMYRPQLLPNAVATVERWRNWCARNGVPQPYLVSTQAYGLGNSSEVGFDAMAEFPPHRGSACRADLLRPATPLRTFGVERRIQCLEYASAVQAWSQPTPQEAGKLFKCVFPSWDNSVRRINSIPSIYAWSTPAQYQQWLSYCLAQAQEGDFVFVNAWNEWAEGAYLEPDLFYGHAYLEATHAARATALGLLEPESVA